MPQVYLPVPEIDKSMIRPVLIDIIRQVKEITNIPKDTKELFLGASNTSLQEGSQLSSDMMNNTKILASAQLAIEVSESYTDGYHGTMAINQIEQRPIFLDSRLGVVLKPIYSNRSFDITVQYRNPSRTQAIAFRDDIYMHVNQMRDVNLHLIQYHYQIPKPFLSIIKEIHRLRENIAGYNQDLKTYVRQCLSSKATTITTLNGSSKALAIAEEQMRVQGWFDFSDAPQKEQMGGETSMWMTEFTYKVSFDVPTGVTMQYPAMVHNQLLDEKYLPKPSSDDNGYKKDYPLSLKALSHFEVPNETRRHKQDRDYSHYPDFDDFYPDERVPDTRALYSALCELDPSNLKLLVNLNDLGEYAIDEEVLEWIKQEEYQYLTKPYASILNLSYYRNKFLSHDRNTQLTSNLDFLTNEDMDLRDNHRVMLSIVTDIHSLKVQALRRLKKRPSLLKKLLYAINISYTELAILSPIIDLTEYFPELSPTGVSKDDVFNSWKMQPYTVQSVYIVTKKGLNHAHCQ